MKLQPGNERGSVLVTTLLLAALASLMLAAQLLMVRHQNYLTARSQKWNSEIPLAEAGVDEALTHLNNGGSTNNGWTLIGGTNLVKSRTFEDGYFVTAISTTSPPIVTSIGYARVPLANTTTKRTIRVLTSQGGRDVGILAVNKIQMTGNAFIDSYDSSNPLYSTDGKYDPAKRTDHATVGSLSTERPAIITDSGKIYGYASTSPGGSASGNIGDGAWVSDSANNGQIQPGHFSDDLNTTVTNVTTPSAIGFLPLLPSIPSKDYIVGTGNYLMTTLNLQNEAMVINGNVTLYVTGDVTVGTYIQVNPGATFTMYIGGSATFKGKGVVNSSLASSCTILGLPTCTQIQYGGNTALTGVIYAPQAKVTIKGTPDIYGAVVANEFILSGTMGIHYDESLGKIRRGPVKIVKWEET